MAGESAIKLDENGDWAVEDGRLVMIGGAEAVTQHIGNRFRTFLGEYFLDISVGVPWYRDILKKNPLFAMVSSVLKTVILDTPGVTSLISFEFTYADPRHVTLAFSAMSDDGPINFKEIVEV